MITYILLTVIPVSLLGYIAYYQYEKSIENKVGEYIPKLLEQANNNIKNQIDKFGELPNVIDNSAQIIEVLRRDSYQEKSVLLRDEFLVNSYLAKNFIRTGNSDILGVFILSKGRFFKSTKTNYVGFGIDDFPEPYGNNIDLQGQVEIVFPYEMNIEFENNPPFIMFEKQLRDYDNQEDLGTIFIAIKLEFLDEVFMSLIKDTDSNVWIVTENGRIIYHTDLEFIGNIDENFVSYPNINGSFRPLNDSEDHLISRNKLPSFGWNIFHSIPLENLIEETKSVRQGTIIVFVIFVIISIIISVILAWNVSNPLKRLTKLMKRVEKGNFDVDLPITKKDEIGLLANSFNSMIQQIDQLIKKNYQIELRQKDAELYALQLQINPHFMYNTLESIGYAVEEEETEVVAQMVTLLGRMLRYSLNTKDKFVTISQELMHINDYLTIQKFRFEDKVDFNINEEIDSTQYYIGRFILQPIVENAIKYSLDQSYTALINISITKTGEKIIIIIRDNGPGIESKLLEKINKSIKGNPMERRDSKFGLLNVHARIRMIYGKKYGLSVRSEHKKGTEVAIKIPANTGKESAQEMEWDK